MKTIQDGLKSANLDMSIALIWIGQEQVRIAQAQVQCGYIEDALNTANLIKSSYGKSNALREIAKAQAKGGDIDEALSTANLITSSFYKSDALKLIAQAQVGIAQEQAKGGDIPGALNTANLITDPFYKNEALTNIETKKKERELKNG